MYKHTSFVWCASEQQGVHLECSFWAQNSSRFNPRKVRFQIITQKRFSPCEMFNVRCISHGLNLISYKLVLCRLNLISCEVISHGFNLISYHLISCRLNLSLHEPILNVLAFLSCKLILRGWNLISHILISHWFISFYVKMKLSYQSDSFLLKSSTYFKNLVLFYSEDMKFIKKWGYQCSSLENKNL